MWTSILCVHYVYQHLAICLPSCRSVKSDCALSIQAFCCLPEPCLPCRMRCTTHLLTYGHCGASYIMFLHVNMLTYSIDTRNPQTSISQNFMYCPSRLTVLLMHGPGSVLMMSFICAAGTSSFLGPLRLVKAAKRNVGGNASKPTLQAASLADEPVPAVKQSQQHAKKGPISGVEWNGTLNGHGNDAS